MPRWAEMVVITVIGLVIVGGLMVFAKFKTQAQAESSEATPAVVVPNKDSAEVAEEAVEARATTDDLEVAAALAMRATVRDEASGDAAKAPVEPIQGPDGEEAPAEALDTVPAPEPAEVVAPDNKEAADEAVGVAPPADAPEGVEEPPPAPVPPPAVEPDSNRPVEAGSKEELLLLAKAEQVIQRIQALKLRTNVAPALRLAERRKLSAILLRLPRRSREQMEAWIAEIDPSGSAPVEQEAGAASANAAEVDSREAGKTDDRSAAQKAAQDRVNSLRNRLDTPRPAPQRPTVNPTVLPTAPSAPTYIPAAESRGLD